jgi:hypothetical protein
LILLDKIQHRLSGVGLLKSSGKIFILPNLCRETFLGNCLKISPETWGHKVSKKGFFLASESQLDKYRERRRLRHLDISGLAE